MTRKQNCVLPTEENWTLQSHDFNTLEEFMKKLNNNWWMKIYITSYCHDICILGEQCRAYDASAMILLFEMRVRE
jgi:hypothetical protein